jgi:hypothetical protein
MDTLALVAGFDTYVAYQAVVNMPEIEIALVHIFVLYGASQRSVCAAAEYIRDY